MTTTNLPAVRTVTATAVDTTPETEDVKKPPSQAQKDLRWVIRLAVGFPVAFLLAYLIGRFFPA